MSVSLPNGSIISVASGYGSPITVTALSNAVAAVATAAAHGLTDADILEVTSGWSRISGRIARVDGSATGTFELEGFDTASTVKFPAGSGIGTVREVTGWTQVTQVLNTTSQGGEQQFANYAFLEDSTERQIPTNKSAQSLALSLADDATLPWYDVLSVADEDRIPRAIRVQLPSGSVIYYNAFVTLNKTPSLTINELMALSATFSFAADPTRYAA